VVQPGCSDLPVAPAIVPAIGTGASQSAGAVGSSQKKADIWVTVGVVALIIAGMLLGAAITRLWIAHFAPGPLGY